MFASRSMPTPLPTNYVISPSIPRVVEMALIAVVIVIVVIIVVVVVVERAVVVAVVVVVIVVERAVVIAGKSNPWKIIALEL
jgi:hypothetical protein